MSLIHIARDHKPFGTVTEEELRDGISSGKFVVTDLVWREGMAEWKTLGEMAPQWGIDITAKAPLLTPIPAPSGTEASATSANDSGTEPAWEERESLGFFPAIARTVSSVLMRPAETFAAMKRTGGIANPLLYFVIVSTAMFAVTALYQLAAFSLKLSALPPGFPHSTKGALLVALIGAVLLSPALYVVSAFIISGITHLFLMILGGANRPFETTFRVICYAQASAAVFNLLPLCGGLIVFFWSIFCIIIGLREAHGTSGWKAALAILFPMLICCGAGLLLGFSAAGFLMAFQNPVRH